MNCPKCKSNERVKDGITNGRQRYQCKNCGRRFSVERRSTEKSDEQKRLALELYLEGLGFRAIGRVLNINYVTIYYWIKKWGESVSLPKAQEPIEIVELDEIHTYIKNKKTTAGFGWLLTDLEDASSILFVEKETQKHSKSCGID